MTKILLPQSRWVGVYGAAMAASFFIIVITQLLIERTEILVAIKKYFELENDHLRAISLAPAFVVYFFLVRETLHRKVVPATTIRMIIGYFLFFSALFLFVVPGSGSDFYHYIFEDRALVVHQQNPFLVPPNQLPTEPSSWLATWRHLPSQHGPMRIVLMVPAALIGQSSLLVHFYAANGLIFLFLLGSVVLVHRLALYLKPAAAPAAVLLYGWNPLLLYETLQGGGTDIIMIFWALLALDLLYRRRWLLAVASVVVSILVKYATLPLLPLFVVYAFFQIRQPMKRTIFIVGAVFTSVVVTAAAFWPFWQGVSTLGGIIWNARFFGYNSFPNMVALLFSLGNPELDRYVFKYLAAAAFIAVYGYIVVKIFRRRQFTFLEVVQVSAAVMLLSLLLLRTWFFSKYVVWALPFVILSGARWYLFAVWITGLFVAAPLFFEIFILQFLPSAIVFALIPAIDKFLLRKK